MHGQALGVDTFSAPRIDGGQLIGACVESQHLRRAVLAFSMVSTRPWCGSVRAAGTTGRPRTGRILYRVGDNRGRMAKAGTKQKRPPKKTVLKQFERFKVIGRKLGIDESDQTFERVFGKIVPPRRKRSTGRPD